MDVAAYARVVSLLTRELGTGFGVGSVPHCGEPGSYTGQRIVRPPDAGAANCAGRSRVPVTRCGPRTHSQNRTGPSAGPAAAGRGCAGSRGHRALPGAVEGAAHLGQAGTAHLDLRRPPAVARRRQHGGRTGGRQIPHRLGYRRIGMVAGITRHNERALPRVEGLRPALEAAGLPLPASRVTEQPFGFDGQSLGCTSSWPHVTRPRQSFAATTCRAQGSARLVRTLIRLRAWTGSHS